MQKSFLYKTLSHTLPPNLHRFSLTHRFVRTSTGAKRGLDLGLGRGFSGSQAAKHLMGLAAANFAGGPGRKRRDTPSLSTSSLSSSLSSLRHTDTNTDQKIISGVGTAADDATMVEVCIYVHICICRVYLDPYPFILSRYRESDREYFVV